MISSANSMALIHSMVAVVNIVSSHDLNIDVHCKSQPNRSKLALYKPLIHIYSCLHSKTIHFSYKSRSGVHGCHTCISVFIRRVGLGYR